VRWEDRIHGGGIRALPPLCVAKSKPHRTPYSHPTFDPTCPEALNIPLSISVSTHIPRMAQAPCRGPPISDAGRRRQQINCFGTFPAVFIFLISQLLECKMGLTVKGFLSLALATATTLNALEQVALEQDERPNIIVILTDDQDLHMDSVDYMPLLKRHVIDHGTFYKRHYCSTAICCPSRVTLWTGRNAHNTNVTDVFPPYGQLCFIPIAPN
jgi:hypothetical protein